MNATLAMYTTNFNATSAFLISKNTVKDIVSILKRCNILYYITKILAYFLSITPVFLKKTSLKKT